VINPFCRQFQDALPVSLGGLVASQSIAILASVDWSSWLTAAALAITALGGAALGLWRQYQLTQIELKDRQRRLDDLYDKGVILPSSSACETGPPGSSLSS
jgi:hypothetical protein